VAVLTYGILQPSEVAGVSGLLPRAVGTKGLVVQEVLASQGCSSLILTTTTDEPGVPSSVMCKPSPASCTSKIPASMFSSTCTLHIVIPKYWHLEPDPQVERLLQVAYGRRDRAFEWLPREGMVTSHYAAVS
jgi:hypothetical protein